MKRRAFSASANPCLQLLVTFIFLLCVYCCSAVTPRSIPIEVKDGINLPEASQFFSGFLRKLDWNTLCSSFLFEAGDDVMEKIEVLSYDAMEGVLHILVHIRSVSAGVVSTPPAVLYLDGSAIVCASHLESTHKPALPSSSPSPKPKPTTTPTPSLPTPTTRKSLGSYRGPKTPIDIIYAVEGDYIEGLGASMNSIIKNTETPERLRFRILTRENLMHNLAEWLVTELNKANKGAAQVYSYNKLFEEKKKQTDSNADKRAQKKAPLIPIDIKAFNDEDVAGKFVVHDVESGGWGRLKSPLNYARFYLDNYWTDLKKFIYLDTDTIVQRDIAELFDAALSKDTSDRSYWNDGREPGGVGKPGQRYFAVFSNCGASYGAYFHMDRPINRRHFGDGHRCAFEAGIYIADWEKWQAAKATQVIDHWMKLNIDEDLYICGSQPPLMALFFDFYEDLHQTTDWQHLVSLGHPYSAEGRPDIFSDENMSREVGVIEWNGNLKPWREEGLWKMYWRPYSLPKWSKFLARKELRKKVLQESS